MITIRRLTASDAPAFRDLRLEAVRTHPEAFYGVWEEESTFELSRFETWIARNIYLGAFDNGALIGMAGLGGQSNPKMRHKCTIFAVYVNPPYRGRGLMRTLLTRLLEHAQGRYEIALLSVSEATPNAQHLYESLGFIAYGREPKFFKIGDEYYDEILMRKELSLSKAGT